MGRTININFIVTKHEICNFAASGVTRYMSDETGGVYFFGNFVRLLDSTQTSRFREVKEMHKNN